MRIVTVEVAVEAKIVVAVVVVMVAAKVVVVVVLVVVHVPQVKGQRPVVCAT